jgi:hypothetical protein
LESSSDSISAAVRLRVGSIPYSFVLRKQNKRKREKQIDFLKNTSKFDIS